MRLIEGVWFTHRTPCFVNEELVFRIMNDVVVQHKVLEKKYNRISRTCRRGWFTGNHEIFNRRISLLFDYPVVSLQNRLYEAWHYPSTIFHELRRKFLGWPVRLVCYKCAFTSITVLPLKKRNTSPSTFVALATGPRSCTTITRPFQLRKWCTGGSPQSGSSGVSRRSADLPPQGRGYRRQSQVCSNHQF